MKKVMKKIEKKVKKVRQPLKKDPAAELKKEMAKFKRGANAKIRELESKVSGHVEENKKMNSKLEKKKKELGAVSSKIKDLEFRIQQITENLHNTVEELSASKGQFREKEIAWDQLHDQIEYKNRQLASKEIEMENYKKTAEEKIFQLEAKIKELEAKREAKEGLTPF